MKKTFKVVLNFYDKIIKVRTYRRNHLKTPMSCNEATFCRNVNHTAIKQHYQRIVRN